ncbi:unnamed protein product [Fraxinus pennsylvanica]|uniref:Protein BCCIP homolog n=1 Tax=Fraxinus pennsylvanica TaxID=56036 RepID=A0AAD2EB30_9LAMI|nr:unnamed protein product [Fraxinus pennsylvanica]
MSYIDPGLTINRMARKPTRQRLLRRRPLTFSPFGRSMAVVASINWGRNKMPGSTLRTKDCPSSSGNGYHHVEDENEQADSSDGEEFEGVVQADFAFFDPKPGDFHGVKVLLQTYLGSKQWDLSGFVDLILGQPTVGTVVKIENDEDDAVYSIITALNLGRYQDNKCINELKGYLLKVCQENYVLAKLRSLIGEHAGDVGLVVSQRVVNLPPQLLPPLYDSLFDEVSWATEDEPTEELRNSFRFKFYLIISKIYKHKSIDQIKGPSRSEDEAIMYIKPEDEVFHKLSSWSFSFALPAQHVTNELKNYQLTGLVMAVEASFTGSRVLAFVLNLVHCPSDQKWSHQIQVTLTFCTILQESRKVEGCRKKERVGEDEAALGFVG